VQKIVTAGAIGRVNYIEDFYFGACAGDQMSSRTRVRARRKKI
jgi:hypothetical protein